MYDECIFGVPNEMKWNWGKSMEAMGIEPMSALHQAPSATCLFSEYTLKPPQRHRLANEPVW